MLNIEICLIMSCVYLLMKVGCKGKVDPVHRHECIWSGRSVTSLVHYFYVELSTSVKWKSVQIRHLFHEPEIYWFKLTYFQDRALPFPQCCCEGHGAANAASCGDQHFPEAGSGGFVPCCWVRGIVTSCAISTIRFTACCSSGKLLYCRLVHSF